MRTGGSELDKKTAGLRTDQRECVVSNQLEVLRTGRIKRKNWETNSNRERQQRLVNKKYCSTQKDRCHK